MALLVKVRPGFDVDDVVLKKHKAKVKRHNKEIGVHAVDLPSGADEKEAARNLAADGRVEFVEVDAYALPAAILNDPAFGKEWHLAKIDAATAWATTCGNPSVVVAVIDTGVNPAADLAANLVPGFSTWDNTTATGDVEPQAGGHGTLVAGVVAAVGNNALGVAGVAYGARVMPIRIWDGVSALGTNWSVIAAAITYAADHGCRVANCSWESNPPMWTSATLNAAVAYMRSKGGVVCFAAGNANTNFSSAPTQPGWIIAAGTDQTDARATFSNYGAMVTVAAPAVSVQSIGKAGDVRSCTGTSFASPIAAAIAALMMSAFPGITPDQCVAALRSSANDIGAAGNDPYFGAGRVNAGAAVAAAMALAGTPIQPSADTTAPALSLTLGGTITVKATATDASNVSKVEIYIDGLLKAQSVASPLSYSWPVARGTHTIKAVARDVAGNESQSSIVISS